MDEKTIRNILAEAAELATAIADATPNVVDDQIAAALMVVVSNDTYWSIVWRIIEKAMGYFDSENVRLIVESDTDTSLLAGETGIDPATLVVIIQAILAILKWWKDR